MSSSASGMRANSVGLAILYWFNARIGSTAPSRSGLQELRRVPARGQRPGLRLAVADDAERHQLRVVEHRAERVQQRVPELTALVERARRLGRAVARHAAGEREPAEQVVMPRSSR